MPETTPIYNQLAAKRKWTPDDMHDHNVCVERLMLTYRSHILDLRMDRIMERITDFAGLPIHRTEAGYPRCATCDGGGCLDCTDPA